MPRCARMAPPASRRGLYQERASLFVGLLLPVIASQLLGTACDLVVFHRTHGEPPSLRARLQARYLRAQFRDFLRQLLHPAFKRL